MSRFWADKTKIPMMNEYNEALSETFDVMSLLDTLFVGWGVVATLKLFGL